MWQVPPPLFAGSQADISLTIDSDTYIGDLYTFLGSPTGKKSVELTVDGADVGEIIITTAWTAGSTFSFVAVNGGRILGEGGNGGRGGEDFGATGEAGVGGNNGTPAINNQGTYPVSINVDDGFLFGGGGGGGGGSYEDVSGGLAGSGGGGGQGWSGGDGGLAGSESGINYATDGTDGSRLAAGNGGLNILSPTSQTGGGDGGTWGLGGKTGRSSNMIGGVGFTAGFFYYGGLGGKAGAAYLGGNPTLSGSDSEATLRAAGRILGEISSNRLTVPSFAFNFWAADIQPTNDNVGISFQSTGSTLEINTTKSPTASTQYYLAGGSGTGANYEVRVRGLSGDVDGSFTAQSAVPGTWVDISALRQWYWNFTSSGARGALFEMRRADIPGTTSTSDEVIDSFYLKAIMESEP